MSLQSMSKAENQEKQEKNVKKDSEWVYRGRIVSLRVDTFHFDPPQKKEIVIHNGAAVMIPIDDQGNIVLVKQWRQSVGEIIYELPAGTLEDKEDPLLCAQRELREEIGYRSDKIQLLGKFFSAPGFCSEVLYLFLAEDLKKDSLENDSDEAIDIEHIPFARAIEMIEKNNICDAKTVAGIFLYANLRKRSFDLLK